MKKKMNNMIKTKRRAMINGEMRMMEKHHHIQGCATLFKEITQSTTYLVILKKG
jgi:3-phosphoglycerate kinase